MINDRDFARGLDAGRVSPKQSTELEGKLEQWDDEMFKLVESGTDDDIRDFFTKIYHSGHTAGQAEEREKTKRLLDSMEIPLDKIFTDSYKIECNGYNKALFDVSSSLNKD